jgi:hypothetical protein
VTNDSSGGDLMPARKFQHALNLLPGFGAKACQFLFSDKFVAGDSGNQEDRAGSAWPIEQSCRKLSAFGCKIENIPELVFGGGAVDIEQRAHFLDRPLEKSFHGDGMKFLKNLPVGF